MSPAKKPEQPTARGAIGAAIRRQRELAQMSVRELARVSEVSNAYLSQIERGLHEPSLRVVRAVSEALALPLEEFLPRTPADGPGDADGDPVESAIEASTHLHAHQKEALLTVYRSYRAQND